MTATHRIGMGRAARGCLAACSASVLVLAGAPAWGNGRYPNADMLIVDPGDPDHLVLRATFGTLVSADAGRRWSWICEEAVGYTGDPAMTVLAGGHLLHGFLENIMISDPAACSFEALPFAAEGRFAIDVTLDPSDASRAWVLSSGLAGRRQASLLEATATTLSSPRIAAEDFVPSTLEVARSRPQRIYVLGFNAAFEATLLTSDDRGVTWRTSPITPYAPLPMYLSAVDPQDPDVLYVRVDDATSDHLIVSRDGGQSFEEVFSMPGDMLGFAQSPDGRRVAVGGPGAGLFVASSPELVFQPRAAVVSLRCLTWAARGLYACAQESLDGWTLALSGDDGQSFEPLWHVQDLRPLSCDGITPVGQTCPRAWLDVSAQIGAEPGSRDDPPSPPPAGSGASCSVGDGGQTRPARFLAWAAVFGAVALTARRAWPARARRRWRR